MPKPRPTNWEYDGTWAPEDIRQALCGILSIVARKGNIWPTDCHCEHVLHERAEMFAEREYLTFDEFMRGYFRNDGCAIRELKAIVEAHYDAQIPEPNRA